MAASGETYELAFPSTSKPFISTGLKFSKACAHHVTNTFHAAKVYIIVSASISKTENFESLKQELGDKIVGVRYGIKPHTPWTDVLEIVKDVDEKRADLIVTLGAGSLTDGAKVISFALANKAFTLDDLAKLAADVKTPNLQACQIPVINIPTSLSGGEYTPNGGATDLRDHRKVSFTHPSMGATLIILDPALSISTPEKTWIASGMRAVDHCVEGLCSPESKKENDASFIKGLDLLVPSLLTTKKERGNEDARLKEMKGVIEAIRGVKAGIPMGASHAIGHQLGPLGVGHGETSCIMLPHVLKYNYLHSSPSSSIHTNQQKVLSVLWAQPTTFSMLISRGLNRETADAGEVIGALVSELGMPRTLREVGVGEDKLDNLAENSMKDRWLPTNPVRLTEKGMVMEILRMALG